MLATATFQRPLSTWEQAQQEFACAHRAPRLTFKLASNGARYYRVQCQHCGETIRQLSKADLTAGELMGAVPFDEARLERHRERRQRRYHELEAERQRCEAEQREEQQRLEIRRREQERREWRRRYEEHLASPKWWGLRDKILMRSAGVCEGCGERRAVEVHHLTYEHLGDEFLWELQAVCRACHERVHG